MIFDPIIVKKGGGLPEDAYTITVEADPPEGGTVSGGGVVSMGMEAQVTVSAEPAEGYQFDGWKEGGEAVSEEKRYAFPVSGSRALVGAFSIPQYVIGRDWWEITMPFSTYWKIIAYGNSKFVAVVGTTGNKAAYSEDGITWTATTMPFSKDWRSVTYGDGKFVAVASVTDQVAYSEDGITWSTATLPASGYWYTAAPRARDKQKPP